MTPKQKKDFEKLSLIEMCNVVYLNAKDIKADLNQLKKELGLPHSPVNNNKANGK